jgi:hypothetical protein
MPNFGYHLSRLKGNTRRRLYRWLLPMLVRRHLNPSRAIPLEVFSYSSEATLPEQIASIRSFLRHAGRPKRFTVVSDGSHAKCSIQLLKDVDPSVTVQLSIESPTSEWPERFRRYLATHPTGKQLALMMSLPINGPALYVDSDVLFFPGAIDLIARAAEKDLSAYYLADCKFSGDGRLLRDAAEQCEPVNTGTLLLFQKLDWSSGVDRFLELGGAPNFFTNQTLTHLVMHANRAQPFDPAKYVLKLDDQFLYGDQHANATLTLRHYVNPVRHKFWTTLKF